MLRINIIELYRIVLCLFQAKLELITGASCGGMVVQVFDKDNVLVCTLDNNDALLGSYPIDDGMRLHVGALEISFLF